MVFSVIPSMTQIRGAAKPKKDTEQEAGGWIFQPPVPELLT
jgi:hypothetical protein